LGSTHLESYQSQRLSFHCAPVDGKDRLHWLDLPESPDSPKRPRPITW
jgi:hypothetical protein